MILFSKKNDLFFILNKIYPEIVQFFYIKNSIYIDSLSFGKSIYYSSNFCFKRSYFSSVISPLAKRYFSISNFFFFDEPLVDFFLSLIIQTTTKIIAIIMPHKEQKPKKPPIP